MMLDRLDDQRRSALTRREDERQALCEDLRHRARDKYHARVVVPAQTAVDQAIAARDAYKTTLLMPPQTTSGGLFYALTTGWSFQTFFQDVGLSFRVASSEYCRYDVMLSVVADLGERCS